MSTVSEVSTTLQTLHLAPATPQDMHPPPILRLPRELRDEIYKYLLIFPTPPIPFPLDQSQKNEIYISNWSRKPAPTKDAIINLERDHKKSHLSIFRVNRQIHDEATEVFYSLNTFCIQVTIKFHRREEAAQERVDKRSYFEVFWDAPWESIGYTIYENETVGHYRDCEYQHADNPDPLSIRRSDPRSWSLINYYRPAHSRCLCDDCTNQPSIHPADVYLLLSPQYRHLIRRVRIDVIDLCTPLFPARKEEEDEGVEIPMECERLRARKLLMPFLYRLNGVLRDAGKKAKVDITISCAIDCDTETGCISLINQSFPDQDPGMRIKEAYTLLIELIWPLSLGPWRVGITLHPVLYRQFKGVLKLTAGILKDCRANSTFEEEETEGYRTVGILESESKWVLSRGRFKVMKKV
ncbi:hypothetical protein TWF281_003802 [Arthrobotrys megalospora]